MSGPLIFCSIDMDALTGNAQLSEDSGGRYHDPDRSCAAPTPVRSADLSGCVVETRCIASLPAGSTGDGGGGFHHHCQAKEA
ncbi:MAG: hypothetical protein LBL04_01305 [Bacteroidales bacterium]|nr:hypothetical protein [Bacteroidales bacterium]